MRMLLYDKVIFFQKNFCNSGNKKNVITLFIKIKTIAIKINILKKSLSLLKTNFLSENPTMNETTIPIMVKAAKTFKSIFPPEIIIYIQFTHFSAIIIPY